MYKGKYFVVSSGRLKTETMVIFPPGTRVDDASQVLEREGHNDQTTSWGEINIDVAGPLDRQGQIRVQCYPDNNDERIEHDTKLAKKTFGP